ncbi:MAG: rod shape-determining protein MreD [Roseinatronobacter sp.]
MVERRQTKRLIFVGLYLGLAVLVMFYRFLPLGGYGSDVGPLDSALNPDDIAAWRLNFPMPDLMLCLTVAWVLRRPDLLPAPVIAAFFFIEDILLMRPPGLWALIVLMGTEFLRRRSDQFRGYLFPYEYALVAGLMLVMFLANRAVLAIVIMPVEPLGLSFAHFLVTVLAYPAVVAVSHFLFGLRKPATGEVDALGQKL